MTGTPWIVLTIDRIIIRVWFHVDVVVHDVRVYPGAGLDFISNIRVLRSTKKVMLIRRYIDSRSNRWIREVTLNTWSKSTKNSSGMYSSILFIRALGIGFPLKDLNEGISPTLSFFKTKIKWKQSHLAAYQFSRRLVTSFFFWHRSSTKTFHSGGIFNSSWPSFAFNNSGRVTGGYGSWWRLRSCCPKKVARFWASLHVKSSLLQQQLQISDHFILKAYEYEKANLQLGKYFPFASLCYNIRPNMWTQRTERIGCWWLPLVSLLK